MVRLALYWEVPRVHFIGGGRELDIHDGRSSHSSAYLDLPKKYCAVKSRIHGAMIRDGCATSSPYRSR